jgi:hypothetical protein
MMTMPRHNGIGKQLEIKEFEKAAKYRILVDQCAYGLRNAHGEHWRAPRQVLTTMNFMQVLARPCDQVTSHRQATTRKPPDLPRALAERIVDILEEYAPTTVDQQELEDETDMAIFPDVQALPEPEQEILPEIQEPQEADREMKRKHVDHGHVPFLRIGAEIACKLKDGTDLTEGNRRLLKINLR